MMLPLADVSGTYLQHIQIFDNVAVLLIDRKQEITMGRIKVVALASMCAAFGAMAGYKLALVHQHDHWSVIKPSCAACM